MTSGIRAIIDKWGLRSRKIFLLDGCGALLAIFYLAFVLPKFESYFGMPRHVLYLLSSVACLFAIYSFSCYFFVSRSWRPFLKAVIIANILYSAVTIGVVIYFFPSLTILGVIYFLLELMVMASIVVIELEVFSGVKTSS